MIGKAIAHFQIEARLGAGGMGEVYQARDTRLGRNVAVKILPEAFVRDPDRIARFEREAKLLASLNHSNIAQLYGLEQADSRHFLIMELVGGETLAERIQRGPIPAADAFAIAHQIAEALEAAHEKSVIHRDLKPANVKITPEGKVKVLDFGLAKALEEASPLNSMSPTLSVMATNAGVILGTAGYMSPEQARGHAADQRSDVFSFGCVLYEMLAGRQPFQGETVTDVIASLVARDPDWRTLPANLHPKTEELIRRCLAKNRKERWHAIADVRVELEALIADPHGLKISRELPRAPFWRRAIPVSAAAVIAAAITVAATVAFMNSRPALPVAITRFPIVLPEDQRLTSTGRSVIAISPDGATIVHAANGQLYVRAMGDIDFRPIAGTAQNAASPFFSPDSRWVGYLARSENKIKKIAIAGGAAVTICDFETSNVFGPVWNHDDFVYLGVPKGIVRVSANGGRPERIVSLKDDEIAHRPQLLPDGDRLLFTASLLTASIGMTSRWDTAHVVVQSLKSGDRKVLITGGSDGRYVPTGQIVYALGSTVLAVPFDPKNLTVGGPVPVIEGVTRSAVTALGGADAQYAFADNGSMVYVPGGVATVDLSLVLVDRAGARKTLAVPSATYWQPRISPDGKRFAVSSIDGTNRVVWIGDVSGGSPLQKLTFEGHNDRPLWTRDGQRVVFNSDREGEGGIFWQRIDGGAAERLGKAEQGFAPQPEAWTPDGRTLIFSLRAASSGGLWALTIGVDQKSKLLLKPPAANASLSPDGRWLAYASSELGRSEIYVQPFPITPEKHQVTHEGGGDPLWAPDGRQLLFLKNIGGTRRQIMAVDVQTERGFSVGKTTALPIEGIITTGPRPYDITPDGKSFLVMVPKAQLENSKPAAEQIIVTLNWFEELKQRVPAK